MSIKWFFTFMNFQNVYWHGKTHSAMNVKEHIKGHDNKHQITTILKEGCDDMKASLHQNIIFSTNLWSFHQTWSKLAGIKISYEPTITGITLTEVGIYRNLWKIPSPSIIANSCLPSSRSRLLYRPVGWLIGLVSGDIYRHCCLYQPC